MSSTIKLYQRLTHLSQLLAQYPSNDDDLTEEERNERDDLEAELHDIEEQIDEEENMHDHENPF